MDSAQRSTLLTAIKLHATELPVIGSLRGPNNWLVLTTERLVWTVAGERHEIGLESIRDATVDLKQLENTQSKLEMRTLQVTTLKGEKYTIELEPGQPLSGTWNVLKNVGTRNRYASEKKSGSPH
jgi:hypothetical protein